jgi:glycosyltransferase involved in cell wall biosynthesis
MKIAFISKMCFTDNIGGVENHIRFLAEQHLKNGNEILIFQPTNSVKVITDVEKYGIRVKLIPYQSSKFVSIIQKFSGNKYLKYLCGFLRKFEANQAKNTLVQEVKDFNPDYIHQHDFISSIFSTKKLRHLYPIFFTNHTGEYLLLKKYFFGRVFLRYALKHYKAIIGPSIELTPFEFHSNCRTIHNGANLEMFKQDSQTARNTNRSKLGLEDGDFVVLCPRRWAPTKGVKYLAKAINESDYPKNIKFLFAGSDYADYQGYVSEIEVLLKNCKNVSLLGNLSSEKLNEVMNCSDIVVIPSLMEAVSLAAVEAMATGCCVISTDVGGMPELIEHEVSGLLVKPRDSAQLNSAIKRLYDEHCLREEIIAVGLEKVKDYSWEMIFYKTHNHFKEVLNHEK